MHTQCVCGCEWNGSFADGEVFVRILQEIRGRDCFVIVPTNSNDK